MKSAIQKPLLRAATVVSAGSTNQPKAPVNSTLLPHRLVHSSSSSSSPLPHVPPPSPAARLRSNVQFLQRPFSSHAHVPYKGKSFVPLGTVALIGGAVLFLSSTASAFSIPLLMSSAAARMKERLEKHGFVERPVVPDGNCQMRALSDQIFGNESYHKEVRLKISKWLSENEKFGTDDGGTTTLGDFIDRDQFPKWDSYVTYMSRNGTWGDHITLLAAAEVYGVAITVVSNVDDQGTGQYVTTIQPRSTKPTKTIYLSHWHEMHYNSLHREIPVVGQQAA